MRLLTNCANKLWLIGLLFLSIAIITNGQQTGQHGEEVYANSCTFCHGEGGRGGSAPRLSDRGFDAQYIEKVITYGVPSTAMPPWGQRLIAQDLNAVIGYVKGLNGITATTAVAKRSLSGDAAKGRDLFVDVTQELTSCSNCHRIDGKGVNMSPPIVNVPSGAAAFRSIATPGVKTASINGESIPAMVVMALRDETKLYDLTTVPPVLRTLPSSAVKLTDGSSWQHSSVLGTYSNQDLDLILAYLRSAIQP